MGRVVVSAAAVFVLAATLIAQQPSPRFEVASIKPSTVDSGADENSEVQPSGRVVITNMVLEHLVRGVFEVERHEMVVSERVPSWFSSERCNIIAQGPPIIGSASQQQVRTTMQNLLVDVC